MNAPPCRLCAEPSQRRAYHGPGDRLGALLCFDCYWRAIAFDGWYVAPSTAPQISVVRKGQ